MIILGGHAGYRLGGVGGIVSVARMIAMDLRQRHLHRCDRNEVWRDIRTLDELRVESHRDVYPRSSRLTCLPNSRKGIKEVRHTRSATVRASNG